MQVPQYPEDWSSTGARRVSVNNLGFGGTNAHAILEEAPPMTHILGDSESPQGSHLQNGTNSTKPSEGSRLDTHNLFVITANDDSTVKRQIVALNTYLEKRRDQLNTLLLPRLAFTLGQRRSLLPWKVAVVASTADELMTRLGSADKATMRSSRAPNIGFVFTGQGANWQGMGRELFQAYPVFSSAMIAADKYLAALGASWSLNGNTIIDPCTNGTNVKAQTQGSYSMTRGALFSSKLNSANQLVQLYSSLWFSYSTLLTFGPVLLSAIPVVK